MNSFITKNNLLLFLLFLALNTKISAQGFINIGVAQSIFSTDQGSTYGCGTSFYDFNGDGWDDLSIGTDGSGVDFYINNFGEFEFANLDLPDNEDVNGITWVDIDNDGDSDLLYLVLHETPRLYENTGNLTLVDMTAGAGLDTSDTQQNYGACWGDYDKDGFLDLYISNYNSEFETELKTNYLYKNNGDFTFTDVTTEAGVGNGNQHTFTTVWLDHNNDGWLDLHVANDRFTYANALYENNGDGTFTDVAPNYGLDVYLFSMSNSPDDYDNDGDLDIFMSNGCMGNYCMKNYGTYYTNEAGENGTITNFFCWGANWLDFDNDMDQDLYISTTNCFGGESPNFFYVNNGDDSFTAYNEYIGDNDYFQHSNCVGDYNNDGKPDILANNWNFIFADLYRNIESNSNHYLKVSLEGIVSNRDGISSMIEVYAGGVKQIRYTFCGEGYLAQNSHTEHFGLGTNSAVDSLKVNWLSGHIDTFYDLDADQTLHIIEGSSMIPEVSGGNFCPGDSLEISVLDTYSSYLWSNGDTTQNIQITTEGIYSVIGFTDLGVPSIESSIEINSFPEAIIQTEIEHISCYGLSDGQIALSESTGIGLVEVIWNDELNGLNISELNSGWYSYNAVDSNNCAYQDSILVLEPDSLWIEYVSHDVSCFGECDGFLELTIQGGTPEYEMSQPMTELCEGIYDLIISDANDCQFEIEVDILQPDELSVYLELMNSSEGELGSAEVIIIGGTEPYEIEWSDGTTEIINEDLEVNSYWVEVTDSQNCIETIDFEITTSIIESMVSDLSVYPNPFTNILFIDCEDCQGNLYYELISLDGKIVQSGYCIDKSLIFEGLKPAQYFLKLETTNGPATILVTKN